MKRKYVVSMEKHIKMIVFYYVIKYLKLKTENAQRIGKNAIVKMITKMFVVKALIIFQMNVS